jgi:hypothetical protein
MNLSLTFLSIKIRLLLAQKGGAWALLVSGVVLAIAGTVSALHLTHGEQKKLLAESQLLKNKIESLKLARTSGDASDNPKIEFTRLFQSRKLVERDLNRIFEIAFKNEIDLQVGDYKWVLDSATNLSRYQITYPVVAEYGNIEKFIVQVLLEMPWVSLDSFSIRRETIKDIDVQADIVISLYFDALASKEAN